LNQLSTEALYRQIESFLQETAAWLEFGQAMQQVFSFDKRLSQDPTQDPAHWALLPGLCSQAAGGDPRRADDLSLAWFLFYSAAHLFDQVEDQDPIEDGAPAWTPAVSINLSTGMMFAASLALNRMHQAERIGGMAARITNDFYHSLLTMCNGQHLDLVTPQPSLEQWMQIAGAKSGAFFRLACRAGASVASDQPAIVDAFGEYGFRLGLLLQILDDLGDFRTLTSSGESILSPDAGRSLAVAYARDVLPPDQRVALMEMIPSASANAKATQKVIELLTESGAGLYLDIEIERQRELGLQALLTTDPQPPAGETLLSLLTDLGKDSFSTG
jgi:geranylgeranyl pyrophosphate synthase